jgi:2-polyprenyl-3-methyl-5-hydroxy-6-metoxy-1,4-benzoquinol methylase
MPASTITRNSLQELLQDEPYLIRTLSELTQQSSETVRNRFQRELSSLGSQVQIAARDFGLQPHAWDSRLEDFYASTDAFLFETLVWNRHSVKQRMRDWIVRHLAASNQGPCRILTFGDGLGIDSLALAQAGHRVEYFEVSARCIEFTRRAARRLDTDLTIISDANAIPNAAYDAVVCLDVLEHVPDPPTLVAKLASYLRPEGQLIVHAPFWYLHPAVVTHLASNRTYSGDTRRLYQSHGLDPIDGRFFWAPLALRKRKQGGAIVHPKISTRARLAFSGLLLSVARWWAWPHVRISGMLVMRTTAYRTA